ncbi:MAG: putative transport system ATP-binding protein [Actinomycetota bacterium]|jgi:putative ABC transport system ATP-binding protein|nr:putative transport system ATP-binding protein [Actinomycetota bacterium]
MSGGVAIAVRGLSHTYAAPEGPIVVLDDLDLDVAAGEIVAVTGPSGAGKTTLLSILGGLERPQRGSVVVGGVDLSTLRGDGLAAYRRRTVGFVFQDFGLLGALTARENIELALTFARMSPRRRSRRAAELLDAVGLANRGRHRPAALSGGESQRVAIARALANQPSLVLADEPTGNLDEDSTAGVLALLTALPQEYGCTVVVVTHNTQVATRTDRQLALRGRTLVPHAR